MLDFYYAVLLFTFNLTGDDRKIISNLLNCDPSQLMNEIRGLHVTIKRYINFETLIPFLDHHLIFTPDEMQHFRNKYTTHADKVAELIKSLESKDNKGIYNFVRALCAAKEHSGHLVILQGLHKNYICKHGTSV